METKFSTFVAELSELFMYLVFLCFLHVFFCAKCEEKTKAAQITFKLSVRRQETDKTVWQLRCCFYVVFCSEVDISPSWKSVTIFYNLNIIDKVLSFVSFCLW